MLSTARRKALALALVAVLGAVAAFTDVPSSVVTVVNAVAQILAGG